MPDAGLMFCLVELALFRSALPGSWMTGVPDPDANEIAPIGAVFSKIVPPLWPLDVPGNGPVAYMWTTPFCSSTSTIARVLLSWTVPNR